MIASVFVAIPMARHLGPHDYGILHFATSFVAIIMPIAALGLQEIVTRELVAQPGRHAGIMGTVLALRKLFGAIIVALFGLFCLFGPFPDEQSRIYAFGMVALAIAGDASVFRNWFVANHALRDFAMVSVIKTCIFAAIRLSFIFMSFSLEAFVWLQAAEFACAGIAAVIAYKINKLPKGRLSFDSGLVGFFLRRSWLLVLSSAAAIVNLKIDILLLTNLTGPREAGIYAAASRISEVWYVLPNLLVTSLFPGMMMVRNEGPKAYGTFLQQALDVLCALATCIAIAMTVIAPWAIPLLFGRAFAGASPILIIHIWSAVFVFMGALISRWTLGEELLRYHLMSQVFGASMNVGLNFMLIPHYGGTGAAIATLVSYAIASVGSLALLNTTRPMFMRCLLALTWPFRIPQIAGEARSLMKKESSA